MTDPGLALALSTVALVPAVFSASLPPLATVHGNPDTTSTEAAYRQAVGASVALVAVVAVVSRSTPAAVAGGSAVAVFALLYKQARAA